MTAKIDNNIEINYDNRHFVKDNSEKPKGLIAVTHDNTLKNFREIEVIRTLDLLQIN